MKITSFRGQYAGFSNFYTCNIVYKGVFYSSAERAFQSAKCDNPIWKEYCADNSNLVGDVKREARFISPLVDNWDNIRVDVMYEILKFKFSDENPKLKQLLLSTEDTEILEGNTWKDKFWGVDSITLEGQNNLGKILMKIREELKNSVV